MEVNFCLEYLTSNCFDIHIYWIFSSYIKNHKTLYIMKQLMDFYHNIMSYSWQSAWSDIWENNWSYKTFTSTSYLTLKPLSVDQGNRLVFYGQILNRFTDKLRLLLKINFQILIAVIKFHCKHASKYINYEMFVPYIHTFYWSKSRTVENNINWSNYK